MIKFKIKIENTEYEGHCLSGILDQVTSDHILRELNQAYESDFGNQEYVDLLNNIYGHNLSAEQWLKAYDDLNYELRLSEED